MQMSTMDTETGEMIVKRVSVPIGLEELMEGLTKEILLKKPDDIYLFAAEYFSQLLLLREKGGYKVKPLRTAQSVVKQGPKQPPEKLVVRGASKQLSRQISVRGESPVKRIDPIKRPRKDLREEKNIETNKFIERKNKQKKAEAAQSKNIESKQKHIISRTASDNTDVLNTRDRSVSTTRRGRSVTKSVQGTPRQKSTSTPRRTQSTTEHDRSKPQTKDDAKQQPKKAKNDVKINSPVSKITTVEEDDFINTDKLTVTSPKIEKHRQVPGKHELASSLIVSQMAENITSMNQNNDQEIYAKKAQEDLTLGVAANLQKTNEQKENLEQYKTDDKKEDNISGDAVNKEQIEHFIKTEVTSDVQKDEAIDKEHNTDSSYASSKTEAESSSAAGDKKRDAVIEETNTEQIERQITNELTNENQKSEGIDERQNANSSRTNSKAEKELSISSVTKKFNSEIKGSPSIDRNETPITLMRRRDENNSNEPMSIETMQRNDDSHGINNTNNTSDDQITNTLADEVSEISNKNIVDTKQSKTETILLPNVDDRIELNSSVDEIDNKVDNDKSNKKINKEAIDSSIETQSEEGENKTERPENEGVKSSEEETLLRNQKSLLKTESNELGKGSQKKILQKDSAEKSLEEVLEMDVRQQVSDQSKDENKFKKNENNEESINEGINRKKKNISDSKEETIKMEGQNENSAHQNEKDDMKSSYPEAVKNETIHNKSADKEIDSKEGENKDRIISKEDDIRDQIEEGNRTASSSTKDESEKEDKSSPRSIENNSENRINIIEIENEETKRNKREATLDDTLVDLKLKEVSEDEIIEHKKNIQKKKNENDNKNSEIDAIKIGNIASEGTVENKTNTYLEEENVNGITKCDEKSHHAIEQSSNSSDEKQHNYINFHQEKTSDNEVKLEGEMEKVEHKESSEETEELPSPRKENAESKTETDKKNLKEPLEENFDNNGSQQGKEIIVIKKSDNVDMENRTEDDNNKEERANVHTQNIIKDNTSMKEKLDNSLNVVKDKTKDVGSDIKIENENGKTETESLEPVNITKNKNERESGEGQLNNEESVAPETKLPLKSESIALIGNEHFNDASKENSDEKETQEQKDTIVEDDHKAAAIYNKNVERNNETDDKVNIKEMPVNKEEITNLAESFNPNTNSEVEKIDPSVDLGQDKGKISNTTEKIDDNNLLKTDQNTGKDEGSKNNDFSPDEKHNTIGNIENNDTKSAVKSELEKESYKSELQKHDSKDGHSVENIIKSVINVVEEGPVDHIKKYIGDFIQGEQQHVFVDNSNSLESKETISKAKEPIEIEQNILPEKTETLTNSKNEDNKLESPKVEDDKDNVLNKNDVMKNIINSTISLAETGTVDEILKAHINDFLGNEKSNVFVENVEKNNIREQITLNNKESDIKTTKHPLTEAGNTNKSEAAIRKTSSKNQSEPETHSQKMRQSTKHINSRSSSQANIKEPDNNSKQNNKTKVEKKLRRVKTVDVIKDESRPKIEVKSRIPTADYRNRIKREKENGTHSILMKHNSQEVYNKLPEKVAGAINNNDKNIDKHDDNLNGINKSHNEVEAQQNSKDLKETEKLGFNNSKLRDELKAIENESKLTTFKPTFNPYILRQEIKNASLPNNEEIIGNKEPNNVLTHIAAALKIQSVWRGFKVRKNRGTIPSQQKSETIEKKGSQLGLQNDTKLKENYAATTGVKPDGIIVETEDATIETAKKETKSDLNIINKSENNQGSMERKLGADENRNQQVIQHSKLENDAVDSNKIHDAAVMIQKIWRAFKVRKNIKQNNLKNKSSHQNDELFQENKVDDKTDADENPSYELKKSHIENEKFTEAAIMIQKLWRGFKIRRNIKKNREEKHEVRENVPEVDTSISKETQKQSGIEATEPKMQVESGDISLLTDDKFRKAAITIQKIWRGFNGRKHLKENNKQGNDKKEQQTKSVNCSFQLNKEDKKESIGELETIDKKVVQKLKSDPPLHSSIEFTDSINDERFIKAATKIQAVWRGFKVREILKGNNKRNAGNDQQKQSKTLDVSNEKSEVKLEKQSGDLEPHNDEFEKAAIKIQKIWRGFKVRKISKKGDLFGKRVEIEKPIIESVKTEQEIYPKDKKSALKIQSLWRGYQVRKNINIIKDKLEDKMTANDAGKGREITDRDILNAATKIQAGFRGYLQRRKYRKDIHNLNSIAEEDIVEKYDTEKEDTTDVDIKSLTHKNTKELEEKDSSRSRHLSDDEVLKALDGLNKFEIPNDIPLKNKIIKPTFGRSHTVQETEIVKKQSSPLLKTISYNSINDAQDDNLIHSTNQFIESSKDSNNNSEFSHLEVELNDAIQNITKSNEHALLSSTMPLSKEEVKKTLANIETHSETSNSSDTEKLESSDGPSLDQHNEENIHSNVESNTQRKNMIVTESGGIKKIDDSEKQVTNNEDNKSESQTTRDESKNDNNHVNSGLEQDADILLTNSALSNHNDNFLTQNHSVAKDVNESAENNIDLNTSASKFNELNKKTVHEDPQDWTYNTSDITSLELDALPNNDPKSKVTDENSTYDRPLSIDSTDSAITVIDNESRDTDEDNIVNEGHETNNLAHDTNTLLADNKVKETLLDHENLINDFQNKLLDQISEKNGHNTAVEDANKKFNIEELRRELEEAGIISNSEKTIHMQHQNSKEESNAHDQLLEYLHNVNSEKGAESTSSETLNLSSRDLPDIKEEDSETKSLGDNGHQKIKNVTNTEVKENIPQSNIKIEKIQSTLKECEDITQEINKGIKIMETEKGEPTDCTVKKVDNEIPEKQLNDDANHTGTVFCKIPKEKTLQEKYIDNRPVSDHIELININKNSDMVKDANSEITNNKLLEADSMPTNLSDNKETVQTNSGTGTGLVHTGEFHHSVLASLSLTSETDSQELDSLENMRTEVPSQDAIQNSNLLHTGELHDTVIVPLPLKVQKELTPKLEKEGTPDAVLQKAEDSDAIQVPIIPSTTEDVLSEGLPSEKNSILTNTKLLHTGELHDTVVVPLPLKVQNDLKHKLEEEGTPGAVLQKEEHSDAIQVPIIPLTTEDVLSEELPDKNSMLTNTKLLHTGELHDTVALPLSMHGLRVPNERQETSQSKLAETAVLPTEAEPTESIQHNLTTNESVLPLSTHGLVVSNEQQEVPQLKSTETSVLPSKADMTEPIQHNLTTNELLNQSVVPTHTGLLHTGELHDTVVLPMSIHGLEASNEQQEVSQSKSSETSVLPSQAELTEPIHHNESLNQSAVPTYTGLLHTGELHDTVVLPLSIQVMHMGTPNEQQEISQSKLAETSVSPSEAELTEPIQHNVTTKKSLNQSSVPTYTGLLHTGELHDTVIPHLSIEAMHGFISNEPQEKSTETSVLPSKVANASLSQPSVSQHTGLLHTGELHDTVVVPLPAVSQNTMGVEDTESGSNGSESTPRQVDSECQTTGEVHAVPIAVQLNQAPAGVAVLTSPRPISAVHGVSSVQDDIAQAPDKGALPIESGSNFSSPSDPRSMESENRKNATNNNKSMEVEAATKIQAGFRGYQVRKQLKLKNGSSDINNQRRQARRKSSGRITDNGRISQNKAKEPNEIEEKSAVKIQAGVRGFLVRRRQKKQKTQEI